MERKLRDVDLIDSKESKELLAIHEEKEKLEVD